MNTNATEDRQEALPVTIREATPEDVPTILTFIRELALYEKEPDAVKATPELLLENVFRKQYAHVLLAEDPAADNQPVGFALYLFTFSTWTARPSLYLEDLFVHPDLRNRGAGKALFRALAKVAREKDCARMDWQVLTWNAPSIGFYTKVLGAAPMEEWRQMRLEGEGIKRLETLGL